MRFWSISMQNMCSFIRSLHFVLCGAKAKSPEIRKQKEKKKPLGICLFNCILESVGDSIFLWTHSVFLPAAPAKWDSLYPGRFTSKIKLFLAIKFMITGNLVYPGSLMCNWIMSWLMNFIDLKALQGWYELNKLPNYDIFELLKFC